MNNGRPDLNLLVVFDAIARTRSVTTAAEALSLSQPAVSHALNRLRDQLRDPLFLRSKNGFQPTPRAVAMIGRVREILAGVNSVLSVENFDPSRDARHFQIGASDYAMMTVVVDLMRDLRRQAPHCTIETRHVDAGPLLQMEAGDLDFAFVGIKAPDMPFRSLRLFDERFVGLMCGHHPLARKAARGKLTISDYLEYPHVTVSYRTPQQSPIDARLSEMKLRRNVVMVTPNFAAGIAALRGTDFIVSLPSQILPVFNCNDLVVFDLPVKVPDYPYFMIWHRRADHDPALTWLRGRIAELSIRARTGPLRKTPERRIDQKR